MSRCRLRFRLRSLLLMMAVVGVVSGLLGSQFRGRVQTEVDPGFVTDFQWSGITFSTGSSPTIAFACASEADACNLEAALDVEQFCSDVQTIAGRKAPESSRVPADFSVCVERSKKFGLVKYDFARWGRYRLDARQMAYVFDLHDPAAESWNAAANRAFLQAAEAFAEKSPAIQIWLMMRGDSSEIVWRRNERIHGSTGPVVE
jgi:hypothetical protein